MRVGSSGGRREPPAADSELDLAALGAAVWRRKWRILVPVALVGVAAFLAVNTITPRYGSEARVLIDVRENIFLRPEAEKNVERTTVDEQAVLSQVQLFLSRDLARDIVTKLELAQRPEFDPVLKGISPLKSALVLLSLAKDPLRMTPEERVLQSFYDRLSVYSVDRSRVIAVDFQSEDPKLAADVANAVATGYLDLQQQAKQDQARSASQWLSVEIDKLRQKVADAEAKVADYRTKSSLFVGPNNTSLANQQLSDLSAQLAAARAAKADAEARSGLIREMLQSGKAIESGDITNSELIRRLVEQRVTVQAQLAEQSATLLGGHPRIKELKAQLADIEHQIRLEAAKVVRSLENDARIAATRIDTLSTSLDHLKRQAATSNEQDVQLRALERDAKSQRDLLESYLAKYREATARDSINAAPADARIISRASVSNIPVYPKRLPIIFVSMLVAFALSAGWVATRELLNGEPFRPVDPRGRRRSGADDYSNTTLNPGTLGSVATEPGLPVALGAIEGVARSLQRAGEAGRRVSVLGASHNIGTSLTAITLARILANDGHVILIDLALKRPNLAVISTEPNAPGISELVAGDAAIGEVIVRDQLSSVHLIGAGEERGDPAAILDSPRLVATLEALAQTYDHVIVDAGAVGDIGAESFARLALTGILVVADAGRKTAALRKRLQAAGFADVTMLVATPHSGARAA